MQNRRDFLLVSSLLIPIVNLFRLSSTDHRIKNKALVVSTWDSGEEVSKTAFEVIKKKGTAIDAVEEAGIFVENTIGCCVGLSGNPDREGKVTLDACIMDHQFNCGSVAFMQHIKHPISVARKIMDETPHVMLVGHGATGFALANGFEKEEEKLYPEAEKAYQEWLKKSEYKPIINIENLGTEKRINGPAAPAKLPDGSINHDTMGTICMDKTGNLSGMCTTSGMGFKMHGRVGDSPIIGAGLYVDNEIGAATASGQGEEVIRICGTHLVVEYMRQGLNPKKACEKAIKRLININPQKAKDFQVGFIALNKKGEFGAYAVHQGFSYAVAFENGETKVFHADSYYN